MFALRYEDLFVFEAMWYVISIGFIQDLYMSILNLSEPNTRMIVLRLGDPIWLEHVEPKTGRKGMAKGKAKAKAALARRKRALGPHQAQIGLTSIPNLHFNSCKPF